MTKFVVIGLAVISAFAGTASAADLLINGAGATFPEPIYQEWFSQFKAANPTIQINYQAIGSGAGIRQLTEGTVDFGASDKFMSDEQLGKLKVHEYLGSSWGIIFSHPKDYTPVCTTELGEAALRADDFAKRNVKLIALSCDSAEDHKGWAADIKAARGGEVTYPIIADTKRETAVLLGMLDEDEKDAAGIPATVRKVFVVGPDHKIKLQLIYPTAVGRNFAEIFRVIDALQLAARHPIATPVNWVPGGDVMIQPTVSDSDAAAKFPGYTKIEVPSGKGYLRAWARSLSSCAARCTDASHVTPPPLPCPQATPSARSNRAAPVRGGGELLARNKRCSTKSSRAARCRAPRPSAPDARGRARSHRVLARPLLGRLLVLGAVGLVEVRNLGHERVVGVRVREKRADREQHLGNRERGAPARARERERERKGGRGRRGGGGRCQGWCVRRRCI